MNGGSERIVVDNKIMNMRRGFCKKETSIGEGYKGIMLRKSVRVTFSVSRLFDSREKRTGTTRSATSLVES